MLKQMDTLLTRCFFFGQKIQATEHAFGNAINALYAGVKADKVEDSHLKEKVDTMGKDLTAQLLCKELNVNINDLLEMDSVFIKRQLYAYHAANAYKIRKEQLRLELMNRNG
jgi:hypothetical protein